MSSINRTLATFIIFTLVSLSSACSGEDLDALLSIMTYFPPDSFPPSWYPPNPPDCCTWDYVTCGPSSGRVTMLKITNNDKLSGPIPPSVGSLSALQNLTLDHLPNLVGPIPCELGRLEDLRSLKITFTGVSGAVPSCFSNLTLLESLDLGYNNLSGLIPESLGDLKNMYWLLLRGNRFTGAIPSTLFSRSIRSSITLALSANELTGDIPQSFGGVPFDYIDLSDNNLTGDASFLLGKSKQPQTILLARNRLAFDLTNVEYPESNHFMWLDISHNEIYGGISEQLIRTKNLSFDASYNKLCGKIPSWTPDPQRPSDFSHNDCLWWCTAAPFQLSEDVCLSAQSLMSVPRAPVLA